MNEKELEHFKFNVIKGQMTLVEYTGEEEKVVIPNEFQGQTVKVIGQAAFTFNSNRSKIVEVVLPKDLEVIECFAFEECTALKMLEIPVHFKEFKPCAFSRCTGLEEIHFPKSVVEVPAASFAMCDSLKKVTCESENTKIAATAFGLGKSLEEVSFSILKKLTSAIQIRILRTLLENFTTLSKEEQVQIKDFLKKKAELRTEFFLHGNVDVVTLLMDLNGKLTLEQVDEYLESSIAREDTAVTAFFLDYKNKNFSKEVQDDYNTNKELVEIGLELPTLKQFKTKWKCHKVEGGICITEYIGKETHEVIPEELADGTKIVELKGEYKVYLGKLSHLEIKANLKALYQISGNLSLETLILPESITEFGNDSIFNNFRKLKTVNLPNRITSLTQKMFKGCSSLEKIDIPENVTVMGRSVFAECTRLKEIILPENMQEIPNNAFSKCNNLTSVILPKKLTKIGSNAFMGCPSLKNIHFPEQPVDVEGGAFSQCTSLADAQGFVVFHNILYQYLGTAEKVVIPKGVEVVGKRCFEKMNIREVVFPSSLEKIEKTAFCECEYLENVVGTHHLQEIGAYAFYKCANLKPFGLPYSLKIIGDKAFSGCPKFADQDGFVIIPQGSASIHLIRKKLYNYYGKKTVISIPEGVEELEGNAFDRTGVTEVTLPSTLKVLSNKAFEFAHTLEKIIFPQNLADIGMLEYGKMNLEMPRIINFEIKEK